VIVVFTIIKGKVKIQYLWAIVTAIWLEIWMGGSTSGLIFFLGSSPISCQSARQRIVALLSCKVEYVAATTASCQVVWLARLMSEILNREIQRPELKIDNKSAISLIKNPVLNDRSYHIDTRFHLIREYEASGQVSVQFIRTCEQLGDILTKQVT
jgi:hypothetical protein